LVNITLKELSADGKDGLKLREGTKANISNILISGFDDAVDIQHNQTLTNVGDWSIKVTGITATGVKNEIKYSTMIEADYSGFDWTADSTTEANLVAVAQTTYNITISPNSTAAGNS
jgi:hypothetical protein